MGSWEGNWNLFNDFCGCLHTHFYLGTIIYIYNVPTMIHISETVSQLPLPTPKGLLLPWISSILWNDFQILSVIFVHLLFLCSDSLNLTHEHNSYALILLHLTGFTQFEPSGRKKQASVLEHNNTFSTFISLSWYLFGHLDVYRYQLCAQCWE